MIQSAFVLVATKQNLMALFIGMLTGVIVGCIPGLTGVMAVALALQFTFYLSLVTAITVPAARRLCPCWLWGSR